MRLFVLISFRMKFPVSSSRPIEVLFCVWYSVCFDDDQIGVWVWVWLVGFERMRVWLMIWREVEESENGLSLFATQTYVLGFRFLYQIPIYQETGEVEVEKKPSSKMLLGEMRVWLMERD